MYVAQLPTLSSIRNFYSLLCPLECCSTTMKRSRNEGDHSGYERRAKAPYMEDPVARLRKNVLNLGDFPERNADFVAYVAKSLAAEVENDELRPMFGDVMLQTLLELPFKIPFIAAGILHGNSLNPAVGTLILEHFSQAAQAALNAGNLHEFKLLLRLLTCLHGMMEGTGVYDLLMELVAKVEQVLGAEEKESLPLSDQLLRIVGITVPYLAAAYSPSPRDTLQQCKDIVDRCNNFSNPLDEGDDLDNPYRSGTEESVRTLKLLIEQMRGADDANWQLPFMPRPWQHIRSDLDLATRATFVPIALPDEMTPKASAWPPQVSFTLFADRVDESVPSSSDIANSVFSDTIYDIVDTLSYNRREGARFLVDLDLYFAQGTFAPRGTRVDRLLELPEGTSHWKPEDVVVEAVFSRIFELPRPPHKMVYYHSLLIELCKLVPQNMAPTLGRAIRFMYARLEELDREVVLRYAEWFAHHLSNFGFTWKWQEWTEDAELPELHPKRIFIDDVLERELRVSWYDRLKDTLPPAFLPLLIDAPQEPAFKYEDEEADFHEEATMLLGMLRSRRPVVDIKEVIETVIRQAGEDGMIPPEDYGLEVFLSAVLHLGSKTNSHMAQTLETYLPYLQLRCAASAQSRTRTLQLIWDFFHQRPYNFLDCVDAFLVRQLLTPIEIMTWTFEKMTTVQLARGYTWELVTLALDEVKTTPVEVSDKGMTDGAPAQDRFQCLLTSLSTRLTTACETNGTNGDAENGQAKYNEEYWLKGFIRSILRKVSETRCS